MNKARVVLMWCGAALTISLLALGSHVISAEGTPPDNAASPQVEYDAASNGAVNIIDAVTEGPEDGKAAAERFPCTHSGERVPFPVYSAGPQAGNWKLTHIMRYCAPVPDDGQRVPDYVSYLYGDCEVEPNPVTGNLDGGCPLPIQVQSWASCERNRGDLSEAPPEEISKVLPGGAVLNRSEDGHKAEIFTGASTIVVYASNEEELEAVASSLRPKNPDTATKSLSTSADAVSSLPAPSPGAMKGAVTCDA